MLVVIEYILLLATFIALATHQVSYVAVLQTSLLFLGLVNRQRADRQMLLHSRQINSETHQRIESVSQQFHSLPAATDTKTTEIEAQLQGLNHRFISVDSNLVQTQRQIDELDEQVENILPFDPSDLEQQLRDLSSRIDNLPATPEPIDLREVEKAIASFKSNSTNLENRLDNLSQRFDTRPEPAEIRRLNFMMHSAIEQLNALENKQQDLNQVKQIQQQLKDLELKAIEQGDRTQQLRSDLEQQIGQLEQQLENLQQMTNSVDERNNNKLDDVEQKIASIEQQLAERITVGDLDILLTELDENLSRRFDVNIEKRITQINQLLEKTQPNYKYELVFERAGSCKVLVESLQKAQSRLILVCPWIGWAIDEKMIDEFEKLLKRSISVHIGWGRLKDINAVERRNSKSSLIREKLYLHSNYYNALRKLETLERNYPQHFKLKLLGTHAKYLVCDDRFAMLGSHNFLTSEAEKNEDERKEGELGIQTNDSRIVADLIKLFDKAKDLELVAQNSNDDEIPF